MSVLAPPPHDELELLIREARARQRRRRLLAAVATLAVAAGTALAIDSVVNRGSANGSVASGAAAVETGKACGIRVEGARILAASGQTVYREPGNWTHPGSVPSEVQCSGSTAWVVWDNGAAMMQEGYVGAMSTDGGRTWKTVFAEGYFGVKAPHELASYLGPWTLGGPHVGYFTGWCPACEAGRMASFWVTRDDGRRFEQVTVAALAGFEPVALRVSGDRATIVGKGALRGVPARKTVTIRIP